MSESDQYPDYDLSFLEGTTGDDLSTLSRNIDDSAKQLGRKIDEIPDAARTETTDRVYEDLVTIRQGLEKAADDVGKTATAFKKMKAAWETWKKDAPKQAEIAAAEKAVADAKETLRSAAGGPAAPNARGLLKQAEAKLKDMVADRKRADKDLAEALEAAKDELGKLAPGWVPGGNDGKEDEVTPAAPAAPAPAPAPAAPAAPPAPGPAASAPAPGGELPGAAPLPPPDTSLSGGPESLPGAAASTGGLDPAKAAAVAGLLGQAQQAAPQQQAQPQPQMAMPAMPQVPGAQAQQPKQQENPFQNGDQSSLYDLIDALAPAGAAAAAVPLTTPSLGSPGINATTVTPPVSGSQTYVPATPWNTPGSSLSVAPLTNPVVTGTSIPNLTTDTNVTGRPDGATPRTATGPSPASHLATATAAAAADPAGAGTRGAAAGSPGMMPPMMPPMMGGPGMGGAGKERETVKAEQSSEEFLLTGGPAVSEAVPGGTIARKEG